MHTIKHTWTLQAKWAIKTFLQFARIENILYNSRTMCFTVLPRNKLGKNFFHLITQSKNLCLNNIMFTLFSKWMLLSSYLKDIQWALISYYPLPLYPSACNFGKSIKPYNATNISLKPNFKNRKITLFSPSVLRRLEEWWTN